MIPRLPVTFTKAASLFVSCDAVIASGSDITMDWVRRQAVAVGMAGGRLLLRGHRFALAVVDGSESRQELKYLAEDMLVHEGLGCRSIALLWAPNALKPDAILESMAACRAAFPAHATTPRALAMQRALLRALDIPHAYGEGLEFLISWGKPEPQGLGHVRWTPYEAVQEVRDYLARHKRRIELVIASSSLSELPNAAPPGSAQRPQLGWQAGTVDFLCQCRRRNPA